MKNPPIEAPLAGHCEALKKRPAISIAEKTMFKLSSEMNMDSPLAISQLQAIFSDSQWLADCQALGVTLSEDQPIHKAVRNSQCLQ